MKLRLARFITRGYEYLTPLGLGVAEKPKLVQLGNANKKQALFCISLVFT